MSIILLISDYVLLSYIIGMIVGVYGAYNEYSDSTAILLLVLVIFSPTVLPCYLIVVFVAQIDKLIERLREE